MAMGYVTAAHPLHVAVVNSKRGVSMRSYARTRQKYCNEHALNICMSQIIIQRILLYFL